MRWCLGSPVGNLNHPLQCLHGGWMRVGNLRRAKESIPNDEWGIARPVLTHEIYTN